MIDEVKALSLIAGGENSKVEFKESVPSKARELSEEVCAFANASGGFIFIGVNNDNQILRDCTIDNSKRSAIQGSIGEIAPVINCEFYPLKVSGHDIWVIEVPEGDAKPYFASGSVYVRQGANSQKLRNPADIRHFFEDRGALHYDEAVCKWFDLNNVSPEAITEFRKSAGISSLVDDKQMFESLELFNNNGECINAIPMFFSEEPGKAFEHAVIRCFRFKGTDKVHIIDSKTFDGPLFKQFSQTMNWLKEKLDVEYVIEGDQPRKEVWEIPLNVFKESLTNCLCHRDYYETGATTTVEFFDDRIEISNPGGLLPIVAKDFGKKSLSRNPKIFALFTRMQLVEKVGSGIPRIAALLSEAGLPAAEYKTEGFFTIILKRPKKSGGNSGESQEKTQVKSQEKTANQVVRLIKNNPNITTAELAEKCGISENGMFRCLKKLKQDGIIYRDGPDKGGKWIAR